MARLTRRFCTGPIALLPFGGAMAGQDPVPGGGPDAALIHPPQRSPTRPVLNDGPGLPIWRYHLFSPVEGASYSGYMAGTDPFLRDRNTTITIPVILVPFVVQFTNTTTGFTTTFDPSTAPDAGCKRSLEAGDPLTRTDLPPIAGPHGFSYHLRELAYFSWFFRTPSIGAGGIFSDHGTLAANAGAVCQ